MLVAQAAPRLAGSAPAGVIPDEFNGTSLGPEWSFVNPVGDGSVSVSGGAVSITSPGGTNHDIWTTGIDAPRIVQQVSDGDFALEAKFDSDVTSKFQFQGFLVRDTGDTYIRFGNYSDRSSTKAFVARINPVTNDTQVYLNQTVTQSAPSYLRLARSGSSWTFERSVDGTNWQTLAVVNEAITLAEIALYAGNVGSPSHTAIVDYLRDVGPTPPTAVDDSETIDEDVTLNIATPGVLANDTDPEGDPLTAVLVSGVSNGSLTLNADGSFEYIPDANFNGSDSFTYRATDGGTISTVATVSITVNPVNDTPSAVPQSVITEQDQPIAVTLSGTDIDGDPLTFAAATQPSNGTLSGTAPNLTYTPSPGYFGPDSFTFTASDASATSPAATVSITVFEQNDPPVAFNDAESTDEDVALNVAVPGVLGNDTDPDGDPLTAELVTDVTNGSLTLNADGSFTYTPNADFNGADSFTYIAKDALESSAPATVAITVNPINDAPVAAAQSVSTDVDTALAITLTASDVEGDPLTYQVTDGPFNGTISGTAPNIVYTPNAAFTGADILEFTASDASATSAPVNVLVMVNPPGLIVSDEFDGTSLAPEWTFVNPLGDGSVSVGGGTVSIVSPNSNDHNMWTTGIDTPRIMQQVLDNDFAVEAKFDSDLTSKFQLQGIVLNDSNNNYLRFGNYSRGSSTKAFVAAINPVTNTVQNYLSLTIPDAAPSYLRVSRSGDQWTFERSTDGSSWQVLTTFSHSIQMSEIGLYAGNVGNPSHTAIVDYFRNITPTVPVASDDSYTTDEDVTLVVPASGVLANDIDPEGDPLSAVLDTDVSNGTLTLNADGSLTYVPDPNFNGADSFTYHVTDGSGQSNTATVTLNITPVNDVPTVQNLSVSVEQDSSVPVTLVGSDADGDPLTYAITSGPSNGSFTGTAPNLTYVPNPGYNGPDSFTYTASDAVSTSSEGTGTITVFAPNFAPQAFDDSYSTDEDTALNVAAPGVLGNDTDAEGDPLTAELVTDVSNGSLTLNSDGSFSYTPSLNFNGSDSFTYVAKDAQKSSAPATVTITVNPINDVPVATAQSLSVLEDMATPVTLGAIDADGDPLTFNVTGGPTNGQLTGVAPNLTYTPNLGYLGPDSFQFTASDASSTSPPATVQINVVDGNAPVITFWYGENQKFNNIGRAQIWVDVHGNVQDLDAITSLTYTLNGGPAQPLSIGADGRRLHNDGDFIVQLPADSLPIGFNEIVVTAQDEFGNIGQNTVTLDYPGRNFWPEQYTTDWNSAQSVQDVVQVVDGEWALVPNGLTNVGNSGYDRLVALGDMTWGDYTATIPVVVHDWNPEGNFCCGLGVIIRWQGHTNDPVVCAQPVCGWEPFGNHVWYQWDEDGGHSSKFAATSQTLQDFTGFTLQLGVPYFIKVEVEKIGNDNWYRKKVWAQADPEPTNWTVEVIRNSQALDTGSLLLIAHHLEVTYGEVQITRNDSVSNNPPVAVADSYSVAEDNTLVVAANGILGNDTDTESDPLTVVRVAEPSNGSLTLNADGSFTYVPDANFNGIDQFSYRAADANATSNVVVVTIDVTPVNDVPVAESQSLVLEQDTPTPVTLVATDPDAGSLTYAITDGPDHGSLSGTAPNLTYTPDPGYIGPDSFQFTASDATTTSAPATVSITVFESNDPPVAVNDAYNVDEDAVLNVAAAGVLTNDTDPDNDPLTAELVSGTSNGTLVLNLDGSFTYTPAANFFGIDVFTYIARDDIEPSATAATVTITVNSVNDVPGADPQSVSTTTDIAVGITLTASDVEGDPLTYLVTSGPANGVLSGSAPNLTYTPNAGYNGPDSFSFTASDASSTSAPAVVSITVSATTAIFSDEFDGTTLAPAWTFVDPIGDSTVTVGGGTVTIDVPGGSDHDFWSTGANAPRIMQQVSNTDFAIEAKFDSEPTQKFQIQGFLVKQDDDNYLRIGTYHNGKSLKAFVALINPITGSAQVITSSNISSTGGLFYLRLTRTGDDWTYERSTDGTNWSHLSTFTQSFTMTEIGLYAGNAAGPAHTGVFDYFRDVSTP